MIPVFEPEIGDEEIAAVTEAIRRGEISGSFGESIPRFEEAFAAYCGCKHGIAVSSGTAALHLAVAALDLKPGEEILVSASTNIATALAAYHNQLVPVPVDSEPRSWNLNLDLIEGVVTPRTRAIIPVHLFGHPVDMDRLCQIARKHNLAIIEDCAESHGATFGNRMTGSFGEMGCFSFYANKVITTGEGGMIVTNNAKLADKLKLLRNLAFTTPRFRHEIPGYNFRMTGYQAAMGLVQCHKIEKIIEQKIRVAKSYDRLLKKVTGLQTPAPSEAGRHVYWMYGVVVQPDFGMSRNELQKELRSAGIDTRTFFCPMNQQPFLREQKGFRQVHCPVAESLWETGFYLPSSSGLSEATIEQIAGTIVRIRDEAVAVAQRS
ncbi:MAG TPA: DegT/DnrJ/EryC1/StrS family aminotransferase [Chthoniobacterales bacterium]|jgi:perosamine synthetase|nr:DegT/DnrJ/EryC1/StrS family aminotransferase [Chthoniobacterales bacterium]